MREPVDLPALKRKNSNLSLSCTTCKTPLSFSEGKSNTGIWYCARCNTYSEFTGTGLFLRTFRKEETNK
jgi:LSD1 subclass zinc finger protein